MKQLIRLALLLVFVVPVPIGCDITGSDCDCPDALAYDVTGLESLSIDGTNQGDDTVTLTAIQVDLQFDIEQVTTSMNQNKTIGASPFLMSAYACTCVPAYVEGGISEISIASNNDINSNFPAGTELSDSFIPLYGESFPLPIAFVSGQSGSDSDFGLASMLLQIAPDEARVHVFMVSVSMTNGLSFIAETKPVIFEPLN